MARYTGPVCKLCRRERGETLPEGRAVPIAEMLVERRTYPPGQHGKDAQF